VLSLRSTIDPDRCDIETVCEEYTNHNILTANIYSKYFNINMFDYKRNIHYIQKWSDNSKRKHHPVIELNHKTIHKTNHKTNPLNNTGSKIIITYELDTHCIKPGDRNETLGHYEMYLCNRSMTDKVKIISHVKYNDSWSHHKFNSPSLKEYVKLYISDDNSDDFDKMIYWKSTNIEFCILPNTRDDMSFVNGCYTKNGGSHVSAVNKSLLKYLSKISQTYSGILSRFQIFVSIWIKNPRFTQMKDILVSTVEEFDVPDEVFEPICKYFLF